MTKSVKQLIHVLWAIEKDLRVIASNTKVRNSSQVVKSMQENIFSGLAFSGKPVSKEEYFQHYDEYVRRFSDQ